MAKTVVDFFANPNNAANYRAAFERAMAKRAAEQAREDKIKELEARIVALEEKLP